MIDWAAVERELGTPLPADYRAFADRHGTASVGDLTIEAPAGHPRDGLLAFVRWKLARDADHREDGLPGPAPDDLLPFGWTAAGETLFWRTRDWSVAGRCDDEDATAHGDWTIEAVSFDALVCGRAAAPRPATRWFPDDPEEADLGTRRRCSWEELRIGGGAFRTAGVRKALLEAVGKLARGRDFGS